MKYASLLLVGVMLTACSQSERYAAGPTPISSSTAAHSTADDSPVVIAGVGEPNDAPLAFEFVTQGQSHPDYSMSVFLAVRPFAGVSKYEFSCERSMSGGTWKGLPSLFVNSPSSVQAVLPDGTYRCRARSVYGPGHSGTPVWTAYIVRSIPGPPQPTPVADDDECEWVFQTPGFWKLVFSKFRS